MSSRPKYFTPSEVAAHSIPSDCWVSYLGKVYNLTPLCEENAGDVLLKPILACSGMDISHWFDPDTQDIKTYMHPVANRTVPYTPYGRFLHIPPVGPRTDWDVTYKLPWWKESKYVVGILSKKTRKIRVLNSLSLQEQVIEVCAEETMHEILNRYLPYNAHAKSYTWKFYGKNLDMDKTLEENGVVDESEEFYELGMDEDQYLPPITLYFNDDLTEA